MTTTPPLRREGMYHMEYYAWRHLPFWAFQNLQVIITVFDLLTRIPTDVTEAHIAHQKLNFFQTDIAQAMHGKAQHPDIQALTTLLKTDSVDLAPFNDLCIAIETEIDRVQSIDEKDLNRYCKRKRGSLLLLCGQLLKKSPLTDQEKENLNNLGIFIERTRLLHTRNTHPEKLHLFSLKDFEEKEYTTQTNVFFNKENNTPALNPIYVLASLYDAKTSSPITLLALSIYHRIKGY